MNGNTRVGHSWSRLWRLVVPIATAAIVAASLAVPMAASGSSRVPHTTDVQKARAYSRCMRSHGVPKFPDPTSRGTIPKLTLQQLGVSLSTWQRAQTACKNLLPNHGGPSPAQLRQWMNGMRKFARCMRARGVASWPDPVIDAGGNPEFYLNGKVNQNAPQIKSKIHACIHWLPSFAISPGNPVACPGANPGPTPVAGCGGCGCSRRN